MVWKLCQFATLLKTQHGQELFSFYRRWRFETSHLGGYGSGHAPSLVLAEQYSDLAAAALGVPAVPMAPDKLWCIMNPGTEITRRPQWNPENAP